MQDQQMINCRYCGTKMSFYDPNCSHCGAPNSPEPLPWYTTLGLRFKSSLKSKQESVWADRLAALMPIYFLFTLYTLYLGIKIAVVGSLGTIVIVISALMLLVIVMYYPNWYKKSPEQRDGDGQMLFVFVLIHAIVSFFLF